MITQYRLINLTNETSGITKDNLQKIVTPTVKDVTVAWEYDTENGTAPSTSALGIRPAGSNNVASGPYSTAFGLNTTASGYYSHAQGSSTTASAYGAHAQGNSTTASGYYSHAQGYDTTASGQNSHAEGNQTTASGANSHAEGSNTQALSANSHAEGIATIASGIFGAHAEGYNTQATSEGTHAEGYGTIASNYYAHAEGYITVASGRYSHSEGEDTVASGRTAHAEGHGSVAGGDYSHAEGRDTEASGYASHAEGDSTNATGQWSHAEGYNTNATNNTSHAEGNFTTASGINSHSEGFQTIASGNVSHAGGIHNTAFSYGESAIGLYGTEYSPNGINEFISSDRVFNIGIGTGTTSRNDGFQVIKDGTVLAPSLSNSLISAANSKVLITKEYGDANYAGGGGGASTYDLSGVEVKTNRTFKGLPIYNIILDATLLTVPNNGLYQHNLGVSIYLNVEVWKTISPTNSSYVSAPLRQDAYNYIQIHAGFAEYTTNAIQISDGNGFSAGDEIYIEYTKTSDL